MFELLSNFAIKALGYALPIAIRWHFTSKKMAHYIRVSIAPEGDGVAFWAGDLPNVMTSLVITNLSPFPIELERTSIVITFGSAVAEIANLQRTVVLPSSETTLMVRGALNPFQANYVHKSQDTVDKVGIDFKAFFLCKVNNFSVEKHLASTHFRLYNFKVPLSTWL
jgi:hypothetical protein